MRAVLVALLALACSPDARRADSPVGPGPTKCRPYDFDIIIVNGTVIDGTGKPGFRADVGIRGDTIAEIGDLHGRSATTTLDATNNVVAPGFIDLLGNSQSAVLIDPKLEGKVRQGVTTEGTGSRSVRTPARSSRATRARTRERTARSRACSAMCARRN
jgi:N-acyl-D-amino-acid deacylase